jgi:hypothetical protein
MADDTRVAIDTNCRLLTYEQILAWADAHHAAFGAWPHVGSGKVQGGNGQSWRALDNHLRRGSRGLPGGLSLARLLAAHRDIPKRQTKPSHAIDQILLWADAHHAAHGRWPNQRSGPVDSMRGETWSAIDLALVHGIRGLPGGTTLAQLLCTHRGVVIRRPAGPLSAAQILDWAARPPRRLLTGSPADQASRCPESSWPWQAFRRSDPGLGPSPP